MNLHSTVKSLQIGAVSHDGYLSLVKASWILVDVIVRHPQLNYLDDAIRIDVDALATVSGFSFAFVFRQTLSKFLGTSQLSAQRGAVARA